MCDTAEQVSVPECEVEVPVSSLTLEGCDTWG